MTTVACRNGIKLKQAAECWSMLQRYWNGQQWTLMHINLQFQKEPNLVFQLRYIMTNGID